MSFMIKTRQPTSHLSNKEREDFFFTREEDDYAFKYVPEARFKHIVKNVQRERCREDEERIWTSFVKEQELNISGYNECNVHSRVQSVKDLIRDSIQDVDRELKRLEEDALPERIQRIRINKTSVRGKKILSQVNNARHDSPNKMQIENEDVTAGDILISTKEEQSISRCNKIQGTSQTNVKKSSSDPSIARKNHYANQLLRATKGNNELHLQLSSSRRSNEKEDVIFVRLDPLVINRILMMRRKIGELLDEISLRLCRIPLPDGDNDLRRRQQRNMEFAIRFSRNYLYDLNRFITSIHRHMSVIFPKPGLLQNRRTVILHRETVEQKLIAAYQLLLQALSAYSKHIPSSVIKGHSAKLKEVLKMIVDLKEICDKFEITANDFGSGDADLLPLDNELQSKCDAILSKLRLDEQPQGRSYDNVDSTMSLVSSNKKHSGRKNLSNRLSMYNGNVKVPRHVQRQRRSHRHPKERKLNVDSRTIDRGQQVISDLPYPSPVTSSSREVQQIPTKGSNHSREDNIETMMDVIPFDSENDSNIEVYNKVNRAITTRKSITSKRQSNEKLDEKYSEKEDKHCKEDERTNDDDLIKKVTTITKEHLSTLVPVIADLMSLVSKKQSELEIEPMSEASVETLMEFLQKYQNTRELNAKTVMNSRRSSSTGVNCEHKHTGTNGSQETRKNSKNMRLICMSSENEYEPPRCDASCQVNYVSSTTSLDKNRIAANDEIEVIVSEETERNFLEYRRKYKRSCQSKPMYSSNTQNKPWEVVSWISDKLVEELIIEIAKELQMNDVIQKLFELEFQDY